MGVAKYVMAGYVLECRDCGVIYKSRQHWYGNRDPTETEVNKSNLLSFYYLSFY